MPGRATTGRIFCTRKLRRALPSTFQPKYVAIRRLTDSSQQAKPDRQASQRRSHEETPRTRWGEIREPALNLPRDDHDRMNYRIGITWLTDKSEPMNPERLLEQLPAFSSDQATEIQSILVLATPSQASLFEQEGFLGSIVSHVYESLQGPYHGVWARSTYARPETRVNSVLAIVDALPNRRHEGSQHATSEGLAILFSSSPIHATSAQVSDATDSDHYTLKFTSRITPNDLRRNFISGRRVRMTARHISLPVANTYFVNGQRTTFVEDTWKIILRGGHQVDAVEGREDDLRVLKGGEASVSHESRRALRSAVINIGSSAAAFATKQLPLIRLTKARRINKAMGNVVAEIEVEKGMVPGSSELEDAVSKYITANPTATTQRPLLIYALVRPPFRRQPQEGQDKDLSLGSYLDSSQLFDSSNPGRLFKVTGGGGGWGKKQGLLSLDPAIDFESNKAFSSFPDSESSDYSADDLTPKGMMPADSTIEFWVWDHKSSPHGFPNRHAANKQLVLDTMLKNPTKFILGTGPSAEAAEGQENRTDATTSGPQCLGGSFGMLSLSDAAIGSEETGLHRPGTSTKFQLYSAVRSRLNVPNTTMFIYSLPTTISLLQLKLDQGKRSKGVHGISMNVDTGAISGIPPEQPNHSSVRSETRQTHTQAQKRKQTEGPRRHVDLDVESNRDIVFDQEIPEPGKIVINEN